VSNLQSIRWHGHSTVSWQSSKGLLSSELADESRYSDLLVIGQPNPKDSLSLNGGLANEVILIS